MSLPNPRSGRVRRTRAELLPEHNWQDARAAAERIRRLRAAARDPDLEFFPPHVSDEDDLAAVIVYLERHTHVAGAVRNAELQDRALLVQYQFQQATRRYELHLLGVLDTGHDTHARPTVYGVPVGLPGRTNCWNRRRELTVKYREGGQRRPTARDGERAAQVKAWLNSHRAELLALAELLVDHRDSLLELVPGSANRAGLAEAIDQAGELMAGRPTPGFAAALGYAMFFLAPVLADDLIHDVVLRDGLTRGAILKAGFDAVTEAGQNRP